MKRSKKILIILALGAFAAAQAVGLFFLVRTRPAESLTLSETTLTLKMDEGRRVTHTVKPASAARKLLRSSIVAETLPSRMPVSIFSAH